MRKYKQIFILILVIVLFLVALLSVSSTESTLLIFVLLPVIVWLNIYLIWFILLKRTKDGLGFYVLNFVTLYMLLVVGTLLYDKYLDYKVMQFDIDHDSFFSLSEQTPEQQRYMSLVVNDLSRNLMPIWGFIVSLGSTLVLLIITKIVFLIKKK